jgi:uncharacterized protein
LGLKTRNSFIAIYSYSLITPYYFTIIDSSYFGCFIKLYKSLFEHTCFDFHSAKSCTGLAAKYSQNSKELQKFKRMDRRNFLTATGFLGIIPALYIIPVFGKINPEKNMKPLRRIITIEEHFVLKNISQKVAAFNLKQNGGVAQNDNVQKELMSIVLPTLDEIEDVGERRIKFMDESGIDMQVLSYGPGSPQNITDKTLAVELCQEANNELAHLIKLHPARFAGFAILPVADPTSAAEELNRAVKKLGLKGAMLSGTFNGRFFDEPEFLPIFSTAQELNLPLYMHPAIISKNIAEHYYQSDNWPPVAGAMFASAGYGWHLDSGIAIVRLIASGIFDKLPGLKLISGHWGELVPFFLNRLDDQLGKTLKLGRKISDYYKSNIYITPSGLFSQAQLKYVIDELGADKIIYSGDYPFLIDKNTGKFLETVSISREDKEKIGYKNAKKLLSL